ncbi:MAG: hypothetical protein JWL69_2811 [Phycisphaerales bacterium]|nr:hypothetical protein [Phycisphaerales bacterium]
MTAAADILSPVLVAPGTRGVPDRAVHKAPALPRRGFREHLFIVPTFFIVLAIFAWFVTGGTWRLFSSEPLTGYYDAQARGMLHGRLDVPPSAISFEAFIRDGKSYGYYGVAPALLRLPLVALFPAMDGRWSRAFLLIACTLNVFFAYRFVLLLRESDTPSSRAEKRIFTLFILSAGLGSTNLFMASRSYVYHEAIMWGATFSLLFAYYLVLYVCRPSIRLLSVSGSLAFMAFFSRATAGAGTLLALCILTAMLLIAAWRRRSALGTERNKMAHGSTAEECPTTAFGLSRLSHPFRHAALAGAIVFTTIACYFAINYAKFRTFDGVPVRLYTQYLKNPERMKITGGRQIHPENLGTGLSSYFGLRGVEVGPEFPWVYMTVSPPVFAGAAIDVVEPTSSIPISMPALFLLACAGLWAVIRARSPQACQLRLPVLCLLIGGCVVLVTVGITERYLHDFYPFLIVAGALGAVHFAAPGARGARAIGAALLLPLTLVGILLNAAFAYDYQREIVWGVPAATRAQLTDVRLAIDHALHRERALPREE